MIVLGLCGKVLVAGVYRGGVCEKLLEASPVFDGAKASRLQDGPAAGQGIDYTMNVGLMQITL